MKPTQGNILIIQDKADETIRGFSVPQGSVQKPRKGKVVSTCEPSQFKIDDTVLFRGNCGTEVVIEETEYLLLKETDIFVTL